MIWLTISHVLIFYTLHLGLPISAKGMKGSNKNINIIPEVNKWKQFNTLSDRDHQI